MENYQPLTNVKPELVKAEGEQARALLQQLSQQNPNDAIVELDLAQLDAAERDYTTAIKAYEQAIKLTGGQPIHGLNPGVQLVELYANQGIDPCGRGLTVAQQTLTDTPSDPMAWYEAGLTYFMCRQPQTALTDLQKALQLHPNWPEALYRMALIRRVQGEQAQADALFAQVQDLDPGSHWPH